MAERKLLVIKGYCPECTLRIEMRERAGSGFDVGPAETQPKCLHGPDPLQCPSYRRAMSALRQSARPGSP
jgi:hypothetical protein